MVDGDSANVGAAIDAAESGGYDAAARLIEILAGIETTGDVAAARAALRLLVDRPAVVSGLDVCARREPWHLPYAPKDVVPGLTLAERGSRGPIALALASLHRDGRVREWAVRAMAVSPYPEMMPFLVIRTADWAAPVRVAARAVLPVVLFEDPGRHLPAVLPMAGRLDDWLRGDFVRAQVWAALLLAPDDVLLALAGSSRPAVRRTVFDVRLRSGRIAHEEMLTCAESDGDVRIRVRAAEAVCRDAVWTRRLPSLRRLARSRRTEVRAVAVTGLLRTGSADEAADFVDDSSSLVRAVARDAARRLGSDPVAHYRDAVAGGDPAPGAIGGLGETGSDRDLPLLRAHLAHPAPAVRAAVVRALVTLDAVSSDDIVPLLRDPAPAVVRAASVALRPKVAEVPEALGWELFADPRPELRRAGYRLLTAREVHVRLRAALVLAASPQERCATRGRADTIRLVRTVRRPGFGPLRPTDLSVTDAQRNELLDLVDRVATRLGEHAAEVAAWVRSA